MNGSSVLVVEDDRSARSALVKALSRGGIRVLEAETGEKALAVLAGEKGIALVLLDVILPGIDGLETLERIRRSNADVAVIVMTAFGTVEKAVRAMKLGASDFLEKPLDLSEVRRAVEAALGGKVELGEARRKLMAWVEEGDRFDGIIGRSSTLKRVFETIVQVAGSRATVLVTGETGTGKELVAESIHAHSARREKPLVKVNCASLTPTLIESELFGHEKGAFTGAARRREGRFEIASGGTLFLDEVSEIPPEIQVKLLRVLQEREFERVGGNETVRVDIRLICATNKDLEKEVAAGKFREDLFYRINVVPIHLPPLRNRREDLPLLMAHFVEKYSRANDRQVAGVSPEAMELLDRYDWPGNIRELENCLEQAVVLCRNDRITPELLPLKIRQSQGARDVVEFPVGTDLRSVEKEMILQTLAYVDGNKTKAAKILGIGTRTLYRKLEEYGVSPPEDEESKGRDS
ncbi:MAG: sigma-54-dependent Fis family transcriptional regulator [Planctomycetes bacterium]|nr:sigma-54-dependent Fis family transcriptional regulator [Planctomycetota bacterium]